MKINSKRLMKRIKQIGAIGLTDNGANRVAFSREYFQGIEALKEFMEHEGLEVRTDKVGNIFGRRKGKNENLPVILIGSHMDTVKNGGIYDGSMGVAAALECISVLSDNEIYTEHGIEVVGFNSEEGGELGGTFGSRAAMGNQSLEIPSIDKKLSAYNLTKTDILDSKVDYDLKCYLELHIEQGIQLYNEGLRIGIAEGIVGITRYKIKIKGEANHAGTTPMRFRKDALVGASKLIILINEIANTISDPFVATVGNIENIPNSVNVIPGEVNLILEIREMDKNIINVFVESIREKADNIEGYEISFEIYNDKESVYLNRNIAEITERICNNKGVSYKRMYSGAGHDAMEMAKRTPSGLIFIPSKDGISHSKEEYSLEDDIANGSEVLLNLILEMDKL